MDKKIKHLELIQGVILRMSNNSFALKGWTVSLIVAMFALASKDSNKQFIILSYFPVLMFWLLDSYYVCQEKHFRNLYDEVRNKDEENIDFSMKAEESK